MPVDIHGKQYATVNERIQELHGSYKGSSSIVTEVVTSGEGIVRVKATLTLIEQVEGMESHSNTFTGHAEEIVGSTMTYKKKLQRIGKIIEVTLLTLVSIKVSLGKTCQLDMFLG